DIHHHASIPTAMAAQPRAKPSRAALNADRARVDMVNSSPATVNVRGASKVADYDSCDARVCSQVQNVNCLHPEAVAAFRFIQPCSPIRAKAVPAGGGWLHEVKFDAYREQAHKVGSRVTIYSRNGHDFTQRCASIAQLLHELPAKAAVLDGEVVSSDADRRPNFARLHVRWTRPG